MDGSCRAVFLQAISCEEPPLADVASSDSKVEALSRRRERLQDADLPAAGPRR